MTFSPTPDPNDDPQHVDAWSVDHVPDARAAISSITRTLDEYPGGDPQQIAVIPPDHDAAGNIVFDGTYIYQYDAWSRLVQVNLAAQPPPGGGPAVGDAVPGTMQLAGPLVKHFTYDGLGRFVRVLSPYPEPGATPPEGWTVAPVRSERLYYDGVRRIQEVYTDPLLALGESAALGDPEAQGEVSQGGEEEGQTLEGEEGQIGQGEGEPGGEEPPGPPPNTFITYLEREYLWGPGDGMTGGAGSGLDELVGIFDIDRRAWWTLLDASGDVVAIVDDSDSTTHGYGTGWSSTSTARLCAQFCYDAYGSLLAVQQLHTYPDPRTGHKGLPLDRLDAGVADPLTGAPIARHEVGATHAYFVRNRHYSPELGRFLQRDPNATGALAAEGAVEFRRLAQSMELVAHTADGPGVYQYARSTPWVGSDALGLEFNLGSLLARTTIAGGMIGATAGGLGPWLSGDSREVALRGALVGGVAGALGGHFFGLTASAGGYVAGLIGGFVAGSVDYALSKTLDGTDVQGKPYYAEAAADALLWSLVGGLADGLFSATSPRGRGNISESGRPYYVGREPRSMPESLAMREAQSGRGKVIMRGPFGDPLYQGKYWVKKGHFHRPRDGSAPIEIHYMENIATGERSQFKFKHPE